MYGFLAVLLLLALFPEQGSAYVGPGASASLIGAFFGIIAAVGTGLFLLLRWPFRRMLNRRRKAREGRDAAE